MTRNEDEAYQDEANQDEALSRQAEEIVEQAQARGFTLATAESCTSGALACLLADAPGASDVLHGGFVVYSKANKTAALGVPASLIAAHTAVSAEVAKAMAQGAVARSPADIAVAITGVAGPEPDEDGNPVGLVHLAAARRDGLVLHEEHRFQAKSKSEVCSQALGRALALYKRAMEA